METVGQAGRPKTITGFQTHSTPVLLGARDRAEFANDDYIPYTNILEGMVVVRRNPDSIPTTPNPGAGAGAGAGSGGFR